MVRPLKIVPLLKSNQRWGDGILREILARCSTTVDILFTSKVHFRSPNTNEYKSLHPSRRQRRAERNQLIDRTEWISHTLYSYTDY